MRTEAPGQKKSNMQQMAFIFLVIAFILGVFGFG